MSDLRFITEEEVHDELSKPYLITINMDNGKQVTLGRDTEEEAFTAVGLISESLLNGSELLYFEYVIIRLNSVSAIALTRQN